MKKYRYDKDLKRVVEIKKPTDADLKKRVNIPIVIGEHPFSDKFSARYKDV